MMPKTVSENLDLILKYRSINFEGDPVKVNDIPITPQWPRYVEYVSNTVGYTSGAFQTFSGFTPLGGTGNTFNNGVPSISANAYFQWNAGTVTFPFAGYYSVHGRISINNLTASSLYESGLIITDSHGTNYQDISGQLIADALLHNLTTSLHFSYARYFEAGATALVWFKGSADVGGLTCNLQFIKYA